jgi:hypothetical protein
MGDQIEADPQLPCIGPIRSDLIDLHLYRERWGIKSRPIRIDWQRAAPQALPGYHFAVIWQLPARGSPEVTGSHGKSR